MKRILPVLLILMVGLACNFPAKILAQVSSDEKQLVIPDLSSVTHEPTATPVVVTPTVPPTPSNSYVVQPGDTMSAIAEKFGVTLDYLIFKSRVENPNLIYPGQTIVKPEWPPKPDTQEKEVIVELSTQQVFVYENGQLLNTFLVSTGTRAHPTVQGHFPIWIKLEKDDMTDGETYNLKNVPWVMYFHQGYGLHGTYWHSNFGHPMSHGCVNLKTSDAEWLFNFAEVGDMVWVIP